jgi:tetratricopeptide (TPR) repeat protein
MNIESLNKTDLLESDEIIAIARFDIENGRLDEALYKLKRLIAEQDPPIEALSMAARLYAQLRLFERAEILFRRYIEQNEDAVVELFQLGMSMFDGGKHDEALAVWENLLSRQPNYPPAQFYRGLLLARKGKLDAARAQLDELLRHIPADNLYFSRARELLQELDKFRVNNSDETGLDSIVGLNQEAYKTIQ